MSESGELKIKLLVSLGPSLLFPVLAEDVQYIFLIADHFQRKSCTAEKVSPESLVNK